MNVPIHALAILLAGPTILLGAGCSAGTAQQPRAAQPAPAAQQAPAQPPLQGAPTGYLQLGHLAPNAPSFDGYFARFGQDGTLIGSGGYGTVSPYLTLPSGQYVWSMRPTDSPPNSPLTLTKLIDVKPGQSSTVVLFNTGPRGALEGTVTPDDTSKPPAGMGKVRVLQGAPGDPLSVSVGNQPAQELAYGAVTPYQDIPAGPLTVRSNASKSPLTVAVAAGSLTTVLVTRTDNGVQLTPVVDKVTGSPLDAATPNGPSAATPNAPSAAAPNRVDTGSGGLAAISAPSPMLVGGLGGSGAVLMLIAAALLLTQRLIRP